MNTNENRVPVWFLLLTTAVLFGTNWYFKLAVDARDRVIEAQNASIVTLGATIEDWRKAYDDLDDRGLLVVRRLNESRITNDRMSEAHDKTFEKMEEYKALASDLDKDLRAEKAASAELESKLKSYQEDPEISKLIEQRQAAVEFRVFVEKLGNRLGELHARNLRRNAENIAWFSAKTYRTFPDYVHNASL